MHGKYHVENVVPHGTQATSSLQAGEGTLGQNWPLLDSLVQTPVLPVTCVCELGHLAWPPLCSSFLPSGLCMDQHRAWQVMLNGNKKSDPPPPANLPPRPWGGKMKHRYLLCSDYSD